MRFTRSNHDVGTDPKGWLSLVTCLSDCWIGKMILFHPPPPLLPHDPLHRCHLHQQSSLLNHENDLISLHLHKSSSSSSIIEYCTVNEAVRYISTTSNNNTDYQSLPTTGGDDECIQATEQLCITGELQISRYINVMWLPHPQEEMVMSV